MTDTEDYQEPIVQIDPNLRTLPGNPWFDEAVDLIESAAALLVGHGIENGVVCAGEGRLVIGDRFESAMVELLQFPEDGLAFVVVKVPDGVDHEQQQVWGNMLSSKVRSINPNAYLVMLPEEWSFRTMHPEMARQFAANMIAFVSDAELAKLGLQRVEIIQESSSDQ